jgi:hypothetical protein
MFSIDLILFTACDRWQKRFLTLLHGSWLEAVVGIGGLFIGDHVGKDLWQRQLDKVRDEMAMDSMAITDSHHPQILNFGEVVVNYKRILISFFLSRYESLPGLYRVDLHWSHILLTNGGLILILELDLRIVIAGAATEVETLIQGLFELHLIFP